MHERILITGSGGQGIVFAGKILAQSALESVSFITFFPAYGAEVRGGTSHCQIILSSTEIGAPIAEQFDVLMAMNQQSVNRFVDKLDKNGVAVLNSSLCRVINDGRFTYVPATEIAENMGSPQSANLVMLGALLAVKPLIPLEAVEKKIVVAAAYSRHAAMESNLQAFAAGVAAVNR